MMWYKFTHWFFRWEMDSDGDVAFCVAGLVRFIKYKHSTLTKWGWWHAKSFQQADKWQGNARES